MNTFNELLAYIAVNIADAGASYRIVPSIVRNSFNWFINLVREHTEDLGIHTTQDDKDAWNAHMADNSIHLDPADKINWDNTATNFIAHENNPQIHTSQAEKDAINAHISDPVKHVTQAEKDKWNNTSVTQAEKDTWNGKATIKGLESGQVAVMDYSVNWNTLRKTHCYVTAGASQNINNPFEDTGFLKVIGDNWNVVQEYIPINDRSGTYRRIDLGGGNWQPWQPISAPKMFATGYVSEVTFNGTIDVVKSVLFDDGVIRDIKFVKSFPGLYYSCRSQVASDFIVSLQGRGVVWRSTLSDASGNFGMFFLLSTANPPTYLDSDTAYIADLIVTIKL